MTTVVRERPRAGDALIGLAAWAMMAGGLLGAVLGIPLASFESQRPPLVWVGALNIVCQLLIMLDVVGLARSGAAGEGRSAVAGPAVTLLGLVALVVAEISLVAGVSAVTPRSPGTLFGVATVTTPVGLLLAGTSIVRAGRWTGWRRFVPLACGAFVPIVVIPSAALPDSAFFHYAVGLWSVCLLVLGLALRAEAKRAA